MPEVRQPPAIATSLSTAGVQLAEAALGARENREEVTFAHWKIICPTGEHCRLSQSVVAGTSRDPLLVARAYKTPTPVLVLSVPPGIYLAPGLAIKIGDGKSRRYPFETCGADGCHTGLKLDKSLLSELIKGKEAKVSFFDGTQKIVTVALVLDGFAQGYEALQ